MTTPQARTVGRPLSPSQLSHRTPAIIRGLSLNTGGRLGPYEITSAIGAGGMGEVYRGRDTRLDRESP